MTVIVSTRHQFSCCKLIYFCVGNSVIAIWLFLIGGISVFMSCTFSRKFHFNLKLKQVDTPLLKMNAFILLTFFLLAANVFVAAEEEEDAEVMKMMEDEPNTEEEGEPRSTRDVEDEDEGEEEARETFRDPNEEAKE